MTKKTKTLLKVSNQSQGTELPCFDPDDQEKKAQLPQYPKKTAPPGTGGGGGAIFYFHVANEDQDKNRGQELVTADFSAVGAEIRKNILEGKISLVWGSYDPQTLEELQETLAEASV